MAGRRLAFNSPSTPLRGHQLSASPQTNEKKLLNALSGSSRQLQQQTADINERFAPLERSGLCGFLSMEERNRLKEEETGAQSHDREAVRRLHKSETNYRRHEPEQGLISPHNEPVTSYLLREKSRFRRRHCVVRRILRRDAGASGSGGTLIAEFSAESSEKKAAAGIETKCAG
ncbi:uncharacterized protein LOC144391308 isoform X2 [Gasterosteus aculeatus]